MSRLVVEHPPTRAAERDYIHHVLLAEFLGLDYAVEVANAEAVTIRHASEPGLALRCADVLFATPDSIWLDARSLPEQPLMKWAAGRDLPDSVRCDDDIPVLYAGQGGEPYFRQDQTGIALNVDLFGGAFLLLTRYEEIARPERDQHERFSARHSIAFQEGFLRRPLVNEYAEILRACLKRLWPALVYRERSFRFLPTHDVDRPWVVHKRSLLRVGRSLLADCLVRHDAGLAAKRAAAYLSGRIDADPANQFDWIMDLSESLGLRSTFFFLVREGDLPWDSDYAITHPWIRDLLVKVHSRGHEIGLHASYGTMRDAAATREEAGLLKRTCASLGIEQERWGIRQHYIRWENPVTWANAEAAALAYDGTLSFADQAGFRCGTCYEFPVFDLVRRQSLRLVERPLTVMEGTLLTYAGLNHSDTERVMLELYETCRRFKGDFVLLWHNDSLMTRRDRGTYANVVGTVRGRVRAEGPRSRETGER